MLSDWPNILRSFLSWRQPGGIVSATAHLSLLVVSLYAFASAKPFEAANEFAPVDVISESQFNEMAKGDARAEKKPEPTRRVDRVAETKEDREPGLAKKDVPVPPQRPDIRPEPAPPKPQESKPLEPAKIDPPPAPTPPPQVAAVTPPPRPPELRVTPPAPTPPEKDEEEEKDAEIVKQKPVPPKKAEPKPEPPQPDALDKLLKEQQAADERRKAEEKRKADEAKRAEEARKAEETRKAEEKKKAEDKRRAEEKARKEKEAKEKEAAEADKLNDAIRQKLLTSKEAPASTGATGAQVNQTASLGAQNATGQKLSPSDRAQLIGILTEQMSRCISYNGTAPKTGPQITFTLGRDGSIVSGVQVANRSTEPNFMPFAEASMRALRNCQPYRIPARFLATYDDWKNVRLNMITDDLR